MLLNILIVLATAVIFYGLGMLTMHALAHVDEHPASVDYEYQRWLANRDGTLPPHPTSKQPGITRREFLGLERSSTFRADVSASMNQALAIGNSGRLIDTQGWD